MLLLDTDNELLKKESLNNRFTLGNSIEVTSICSKHTNRLIADNLSSSKYGDKLMMRYTPVNSVFLSDRFLQSDKQYVSCLIDSKTHQITIGDSDEFESSGGILALSGELSANGMIESERPILCSKKLSKSIRDRVRVLAIGIRGDKLLGLYYIPSIVGVVLGTETRGIGLSSITYKLVNTNNYQSFYIDDWFEGSKIKEMMLSGVGV